MTTLFFKGKENTYNSLIWLGSKEKKKKNPGTKDKTGQQIGAFLKGSERGLMEIPWVI